MQNPSSALPRIRAAVRRAALALLLGLAGTAPSAGCSAAASVTPPAAVRAPDPAAAMVVRVDRRQELFGILFRLAGAGEYRMAEPTRYVRDVDAHFERFKDHPAVSATQALREAHGISFDAPQSLWVYLDDDLVPRRPLAPRPPGMDERWIGVDLGDYLAKVRDFAQVAAADAFFAAREAYFRDVAERYRRPIEQANAVAWFDGFFGRRRAASYVVVPGLLNGRGNYGPSAVFADGRVEMYQVIWLENLDADELPRPSDKTIELLVHELAHSYVNPLLEPHMARLEPHLEPIMRLVERPMRRQAYGDVYALGNESLVRAVTVLYAKDTLGARRAEALIRDEAYRSFYWVGELSMLLEEYRGQAAKSRDMEAFLPRIIAFFEGVARRYASSGLPRLRFRGPIPAVMDRDIALVGPQASPATAALAAYLLKLRQQALASATVVDDAERAWSGAGGENLVLYGSPASNELVARVVEQSGWRVDAEGISIAGKRFAGASLVLIACRPHPLDADRGILVYTAARDDDLVGVNGLFPGPVDWVVARRLADGTFTVIDAGRFDGAAAR